MPHANKVERKRWCISSSEEEKIKHIKIGLSIGRIWFQAKNGWSDQNRPLLISIRYRPWELLGLSDALCRVFKQGWSQRVQKHVAEMKPDQHRATMTTWVSNRTKHKTTMQMSKEESRNVRFLKISGWNGKQYNQCSGMKFEQDNMELPFLFVAFWND